MLKVPYYLLKSKRFLPIFIVQFLGAMNDNLYKNSFIILITFSLTQEAKMPLAIGLGIFILPFFLFSATAGELADKIEKGLIIQWIKFAEIIILGIGATTAFYLQSTNLLYLILFVMGTHSAFFGPLKYSILPQHLRNEELLYGNAWIEASTFVAILSGTIIGGALILINHGIILVSVLLLVIALAGWITSFYIPLAKSDNPNLKIHLNFAKATAEILNHVNRRPHLFRIIVGISWFWFIGATLLTIIPLFTKDILHGNQHTVTFLLCISIIGIGAGAIGSYKLLKGQLSSKYVPLGGLGISFFIILLITLGQSVGEPIVTVLDFLSTQGIGILTGILGIGLGGGFVSVPLYALLQHCSTLKHRSRNIAANNIINSLFMVLSSLLAVVIFHLGGNVYVLLIITAILNICVSIYMCWTIPKTIIIPIFCSFLRFILKLLYRVEVKGIQNLATLKGSAIIISNHASLLDAILIGAFLPGRFIFPVDSKTSKLWWVKPALLLTKTISIDPRHPFSLKDLIKIVEKGDHTMIFPEGRITVTGSIMKIYEGPGYVALKTDAEILPIFIDGAKYSTFSYLKGKVGLKWFPKIHINIFPTQKIKIHNHTPPKEARHTAARQIYEMMINMELETANKDITLFSALLQAAHQNGISKPIISDVDGEVLSYRQLIARSLVLGEILTKKTEEGDPIGLMLPNSTTAVLAFFGLQSKHRIATMINYSSSPANILSACQIAKVKLLWTSTEFVEKADLNETLDLLRKNHIKIKFLENYKNQKNQYRAMYVLAMIFPKWLYKANTKSIDKNGPNSPSTILFTSGSTGEPKGVVLSHKNIIYNYRQINSVIALSMQDKVLAMMPIFHAFGLTCGIVSPILSGTRVFTYPTPLHYKTIPEIIYQDEITILFATNTFLRGYAKYGNPFDLRSVRYLFGGAEKIQESTRLTYYDKYRIHILEGYGTTEASPVICINTIMYNKTGTVGKFLPGISYQLKEITDINDGKELWIKGNNVMLGYMLHSKPGKIEPLDNGWLNTGDIVKIDEEGFVTIVGRTKRFAKIGGEMVGLDIIEELANQLWPNYIHACISQPHLQKGECLILVTQKHDADLDEFRHFAKEQGLNPLFIPKIIKIIPQIPLLGSGKPNYIQLAKEIIS